MKRRSPSAGPIAAEGLDPVALARAYEAGGATAISVLCEPHWFGGSVDDLRRVRRSVGVPVLAKDFVVVPGQLELLRAAGADLVLLLAVLHLARRLARLATQALDLGLEPLVEVHDERQLERALGTQAPLIGVNNRDLRTLLVDPERALRLRELVPDDRLAVAESGVREPETVATWRAASFDAALVGEALVRARDPRAEAGRFVAAGRPPADIGNAARQPEVKICGVTDRDGILAAVRAGADAIGLNLVPGTPRALPLDEAAALAALARTTAAPDRRPKIVAITVDRSAEDLNGLAAALDADAVQLNGAEPPALLADLDRPAWKVLHLPPDIATRATDEAAPFVERARSYLAAGCGARPPRHGRRRPPRRHRPAGGRQHRGGGGARGAGHARRRPHAGERRAGAPRDRRARRRRRLGRRGAQAAGRAPAERIRWPWRCSRRARTARTDRPHIPSRSTPVHPGLLTADERGRWGTERQFGGRYVPETLMAALAQLDAAYAALRHDPRFWSELRELLGRYAGRPDRDLPGGRARRRRARPGEEQGDGAARLPHRLRLYLKREDLAHTGAHKINNALGQALLTRRLGKSRVIAETGAGQHGVATATACALLDLPCVVYMGAEDIERQQPNVLRMRALGAEVRPVTSGSATLKDAINDAMRDWVTNVESTHYVLGSAMGPHPIRRSSATSSAPSATRRRRSSSRSRAACRTSSWPASAAARTRSGCSTGSSASHRFAWRSRRRPVTASRRGAMPRPSPAARPGSCTAPDR